MKVPKFFKFEELFLGLNGNVEQFFKILLATVKLEQMNV